MTSPAIAPLAVSSRVVLRHSALVRVCHWINALCFVLLLMSGMQIFNAHPMLNWGEATNFSRPFFSLEPDGFPSWATLPATQDLAAGRRWHFFFAWALAFNGAVYAINLFARGHIRDLWPGAREIRTIPRAILDHARLRFPKGDEARRYNVLQKLAYLSVVVALPILILAGLTMSPAMDAAFPWLLSVFGGRQSARAVHFLMATYLVGFLAVHLAMVLVSGLANNMNSMITGRYRIEEGDHDA
jgi:thiosulfate reductase cytochrome b subunit